MPALRSIPILEFIRRIKPEDTHDVKKYALFLGAGCSVSSDIPDAATLVRDHWLPLLRKYNAPERVDIDQWAKETIVGYDPKNPASSYGVVFDRCFDTPAARQNEIEKHCDRRTPGFGYAVLAQLVAGQRSCFNVVLTTNFDDLVADALYLYSDERPLVIHHDSLATFIRPTRPRPLVIKLHGDLRLSPRNTANETANLAEQIETHTAMVLNDRGIIFLGYGGNDSSIRNMLKRLPQEALQHGVYWVHPREPQGPIRDWLIDRNGAWVQSDSFDQFMLLLQREFGLPHPSPDRFTKIFSDYMEKRKELETIIDKKPESEPGKQALQQALSDTEASLPGMWKLLSEADRLQRTDPDAADRVYKQAVEAFPRNPAALNNYALFLKNIRKDHDAAEALYKHAIELDLNNARILNNYAILLTEIRKDHDAAEALYKRALEAAPNHANNLGNYANFLKNIRKDHDAAEALYKRALEADPNHANNLGNYAGLLFTLGRPEAPEFLQRSINALGATPVPIQELENAFYAYAHLPPQQGPEALSSAKRLILAGTRSPGWDFSANVARAVQDQHPEATWLPKLAAIINDEAELEALNEWPLWKKAKP